MYWTRVTIQTVTDAQSGTGNVQRTYAAGTGMGSIEARVLPLVVDEKAQDWATPEERAYEVHLRGAWPGVVPLMRVLDGDGQVYDIRQVIQPPPFGEPMTTLHVVQVTP